MGKTYIIRKFLEENSKSFVEFNHYDDNLAKEAFVKELRTLLCVGSFFVVHMTNNVKTAYYVIIDKPKWLKLC